MLHDERWFRWVVAGIVATLFLGCGSDDDGSMAPAGMAPEEFQDLSISMCDPQAGPFQLEVDNPYFPLPVGRVLVLEGEEDDALVRVEITVLDETEAVAGVTTRVVEEREFEDGELVEVSRNFYAQAPDGTVCYFGERVDDYEDGEIVGHAGAWRAGEGENRPGIIMPADPQPGTKFLQESAPAIAEDVSAITAVGQTFNLPSGNFRDVVRTVDWNPLEEQTSADGDPKVYAEDVGLILDGPAELVSFTP